MIRCDRLTGRPGSGRVVGIERKGSAVVRKLRMVAVAMVGALVLSACIETRATDAQVVTAPDAAATGFGSAFAMDEDRLAVRAEVGGAPVVYVFDAVGTTWDHSATLTPPSTASGAWARTLSISGDVLAVADPGVMGTETEEYGVIDVYEHTGGAWAALTTVRSGRAWSSFASGVSLAGDNLVIRSAGVCDFYCSPGGWRLYRRDGQTFAPASGSGGPTLTVGIDGDRIALTEAGYWDWESYTGFDNVLSVRGGDGQLLLNERVPVGDPDSGDPGVFDLFTDVDLSGDLLAYESCCTSDSNLYVRRFDGSTYVAEASFPVSEQSAGFSVLANGVILVADAGDGVWHSYARHEGTWQHSTDLALPAGASFSKRPVAAGNRVAVAGTEAIHVLTVEAVDVTAD